MATKWQKKGVGVSLRRGTSQKKSVTNEQDGSRAGYHIEHWDDHQDAIAMPKTVEVKIKINKGE